MACCPTGNCCMNVATATCFPPASSTCCPCVPGVPPAYACCDPCCEGCPRGYKPCTMRMTAPASCDPRGIWIATVEPCPPGSKKGGSCSPCYSPCTPYRANGLDDGGCGRCR